MPTYQYRCTECGHDLEAVQKFSDAALTECPNCGGKLRKVFNAVGVVFKGSGFYRTDNRTKPSEGGSSGEKKSGDGDKKSGTTTESKPAKEPAAASSSAASSGSTGSGSTSNGSSGSSAGSGSSSTGKSSS